MSLPEQVAKAVVIALCRLRGTTSYPPTMNQLVPEVLAADPTLATVSEAELTNEIALNAGVNYQIVTGSRFSLTTAGESVCSITLPRSIKPAMRTALADIPLTPIQLATKVAQLEGLPTTVRVEILARLAKSLDGDEFIFVASGPDEGKIGLA